MGGTSGAGLGDTPTRRPDVRGFTEDEVIAIDAVVAQLPIAVVVHSLDSVIVAANGECRELLGYDAGDLTGAPVTDFIPDSERVSARRMALDIASSPVDVNGRTEPRRALRQLRRKDGVIVSCWMHVGVGVLAGHEVFIVCMDLVNPVVHDAHLWRSRAERDDLTGLSRRAVFLDHLNSWIADDGAVTLAFIDVDNLKIVNDTHGHSAGDSLLEAVALRLREWLPGNAIAGRFAGDEFVVALPQPSPEPSLDALCIVLDRALTGEPVAWNGRLLTLAVSVGAVERLDDEDCAALVARADQQMYAAKTKRRRD
ncbi:sensor domain-containing diguanylate cyclase [Rhodococcus sp. RS1C4]|uniref:sensor domain-containing diguanylate cyclase n=1 Tax=Nocardiaceae TaxID=85025 RepID=UPI00035E9F11|nr:MULTISPECIES: diguanylate cyclase [Rhodococcus]OZC55649.1 sensor domain-containing diguanylate cyclase [Rhodococcus sp. 06-621-2]OZC58768.1 sensor domain-containing diguanylate cyclase [Rhodococcus sp. RS1C4]OZC92911.1 sensor domain-containing diguanylate cyclase [Rhodococcus sp. 06-418-1B]OZF57100.1 sensor domain-containing diguanylate cyclase [Rhodococcus sp. 14-2470-1a]